MAASSDLPAGPRPIRSYVLRSGRLTDAQAKAIAEHWQDFVVPFNGSPLNLQDLFPQSAPLIVEIGFGMGESLLAMAQADPHRNYLGIEVHRPGVGKLLLGISAAGISNLRIINHDAKEVMEKGIAADSLAGVQIYFPDPWHKKKHNKRRLIQPDFVALLAARLQPGGFLHLATDWQPYAEHMLEVLNACPDLHNRAGNAGYMTDTGRPLTKFERRGQRLGHGVWDLVFDKPG
ncbi:MAG: hypothetical protein RLZZ385_2707 [Pseudomonadota bacterium]|jgi:tRNA (guanine-N7-)-methyltransferase